MKKNGIFVVLNEDFKLRYNTLKLISELKKNVQTLFVSYDKTLGEADAALLESFSDYQISFDHIGKNVIKCYLESLLYIKNMNIDCDCDEWVLMNNTVLGPFFSMDELIHKCDNDDVDFWGGYYQPTWKTEDHETIKEYIPAFLWGMRTHFLLSKEFINLSEEILKDIDENISPREYEHYWLIKLKKYGVKIGIAEKLFQPNEDIERNYGIMEYECDSIVENRKFPLLDKFIFHNIYSSNNALKNVVYRLKNNDYYDIEKLAAELIQIFDVRDLVNGLKMNYILPLNYEMEGKCSSNSVALFIHLYYAELVEDYIKYIEQVPEFVDIFITVSMPETYEILSRIKENKKLSFTILQVKNRGRDAAALLVGCKDIIRRYSIVGFVHDKKTSGNQGSLIRGSLFSEAVWSNCIGSREYVLNVLKLFEKYPLLGFLSPPFPKFYDYWDLMGREWTNCFEETRKLYDRLHLNVPFSPGKAPIAFSNSFWCRSEVLEALLGLDWNYDDFPEEPLGYDGTINHAIERIYPYCAQEKGYYSGIIENDAYAESELLSLSKKVTKLNVRIADLEKHISDLEVRNDEIAEQFHALRKHDADVSAHVKVLEKRNHEVEQEFINLHKHDADVSAYVKVLEERNHHVEQEFMNLHKHDADVSAHIKVLENRNHEVEQALMDLQKCDADKAIIIEELKEKNVCANEELNTIRERMEKIKTMKQELELQNQLLINRISELEKAASLYEVWNVNTGLKNIVNRGNVNLRNTVPAGDDKIINFVNKCSKVYVYGAGKKAVRIAGELQRKGLNFDAFLVSNNQAKAAELLGHPVKRISEVSFGINEGVIVALNLTNAKDALGDIMNSNVGNIYFAK